MNKPYIICHMMTSVDGRIDCAMTTHLPGEEYYSTLEELDVDTHLSGRVTAQMEMSLPGIFESSSYTPLNEEAYSMVENSNGYEVIVDTKGTLLWPEANLDGKGLVILTSEKVSKEYLCYLDSLKISWIATGKEKIDLVKACDYLANKFNVMRMAVVGGGHINAAFLKAGLLDEVSILIGAGIDGRGNMTAVFDGLEQDQLVTQLKLMSVQQYESDAVWLRYLVKKYI